MITESYPFSLITVPVWKPNFKQKSGVIIVSAGPLNPSVPNFI